MKERRNYYRILQVQPDAQPEIIQGSYRALMKELQRHPDLGGSTEGAVLLNEAYATLMDPEKRAAYDDRMFQKSIAGDTRFMPKGSTPPPCPVCGAKVSRPPKSGEFCMYCHTPLRSDHDIEVVDDGRRTVSRMKSSAPLEYHPAWPGTPRQGRMLDFSPKGLRFLCHEELTAGTVLKISSPLLEASGAVTNLSEVAETTEGRKSYAVGVRFLAVHFADTRGTFFSTSA
ncbi:MAG: DnaJ domain-containing protein [Acidobacteriota bacterium]|jgi:curved DNA-binding protein CbpA|nr:DnaJ domain-containing protein [Acidobacteriota bacterium]